MTHDEIKNGVAERANLTKQQAEVAVKAHLDLIKEGLIKDHEVRLLGIGTLKLKARAARAGRNPRTKEEINIPASIGIGLSASKALKEEVNSVVDIASFPAPKLKK